MGSWNPSQYLKYAGPRLRPAVDLIERAGAAFGAAPRPLRLEALPFRCFQRILLCQLLHNPIHAPAFIFTIIARRWSPEGLKFYDGEVTDMHAFEQIPLLYSAPLIEKTGA